MSGTDLPRVRALAGALTHDELVQLVVTLWDADSKSANAKSVIKQKLFSDEKIPPKVPSKAPPGKLKAPPKKAAGSEAQQLKTISSQWIQLLWSSAPGRCGKQPPMAIPENLASLQEALGLPSSSVEPPPETVFTTGPDPLAQESLDALVASPEFTEAFAKQKKRQISSSEASAEAGVPKPSKHDVIGQSFAQRMGITVNVLKKSYEKRGGWHAFVQAFWDCSMSKQDIDLLMDTVPDEAKDSGSRKLQDWHEAITKIKNHQIKNPGVVLSEEEEYILLVSTITLFHQRLECLYICFSFDTILVNLKKKINLIVSGLELICSSESIKLLFQIILNLGNYLNQGTTLGSRQWFRIDTLKLLSEVKCNSNINAWNFLAERFNNLFTDMEVNALRQAKDAGAAIVYETGCQLADTISILIQAATSDEHTDMMATSVTTSNARATTRACDNLEDEKFDFDDKFKIRLRTFLKENRSKIGEFVQVFSHYVYTYYGTATYLADPESFIPINKRIDDGHGGWTVAPDIFNRVYEAVVNMKAKTSHSPETIRTVPSSSYVQSMGKTGASPFASAFPSPFALPVASPMIVSPTLPPAYPAAHHSASSSVLPRTLLQNGCPSAMFASLAPATPAPPATTMPAGTTTAAKLPAATPGATPATSKRSRVLGATPATAVLQAALPVAPPLPSVPLLTAGALPVAALPAAALPAAALPAGAEPAQDKDYHEQENQTQRTTRRLRPMLPPPDVVAVSDEIPKLLKPRTPPVGAKRRQRASIRAAYEFARDFN